MVCGGISGLRRRCAACLVAFLVAAVFAGCSKKAVPIKGAQLPVFPVKGKLVMDGKPMAAALIVFNPVVKFPAGTAQLHPHATADENGEFTVSTYGAGDGAPAGDYKITISWKGEDAADLTDGGRAEVDEKAPAVFQNARTSRIRVKVKEEPNTLQPWDLAQLEGRTPSTP
jgi:hypothetical protein